MYELSLRSTNNDGEPLRFTPPSPIPNTPDNSIRDDIDSLMKRANVLEKQFIAVDDRLLHSVASLDEQICDLQALFSLSSSVQADFLVPDTDQLSDEMFDIDIKESYMLSRESIAEPAEEVIEQTVPVTRKKSSIEKMFSETSPTVPSLVPSPASLPEALMATTPAAIEVQKTIMIDSKGKLNQKEFEKFVAQNSTQLKAMQHRLKSVAQENSRKLLESRQKLENLEKQLAEFSQNIEDLTNKKNLVSASSYKIR